MNLEQQTSADGSIDITIINPKGLNFLNGAFVLLSVFVGCGVLSLPYAYYQIGIGTSILICIFQVLLKGFTVGLYLDSMRIIPSKPTTLIGIGMYVCGRFALFAITLMITINQISLNMVYLIVLGNTLSSLCIDVFETSTDSLVASRHFYVTIITIV